MSKITKTVIHLGLAVLLSLLLTGCGAGMRYGLVLGDGLFYDRPDIDIIVYDGLWDGDYVYYRGDWYYRGYNTPYLWIY